MKSFKFETTVFRLNRTISLDLTHMLQNGEVNHDDNVMIEYNQEDDTITGIVVADNQRFGHIFDPTSYKDDPDLVEELYGMKDED